MVNLLTLQCPSCGGKTGFTPSVDRFVCEYCGNTHLFQLPDPRPDPRFNPPATEGDDRSKPIHRIVPRPRQVTVEKQGRSLRLVWRWYSATTLGLAFFCVVWDAFLCGWYGLAFSMDEIPWMMVLFPIGHLAVGIGLTYSALAGILNKTTVTIDTQFLVVQHDPVPWPGETRTPIANLAQLYCKAKEKRGKESSTPSYQLCAVLKDGHKLDLASNLSSPELAAFLEQAIESWLNIADTPVAGESMV